ncbi:MAG: class I SAM-dependent methyltransferase [Pseudomonadota bacterium]
MDRILEPELMNDPEQVQAYSHADFGEAHQSIIENFAKIFPTIFSESGQSVNVLDLGCGSGDVTVRFAQRYTECHIDAIDGAAEMLKQAEKLISMHALSQRITLHLQQLPNCTIEKKMYQTIFSNSLLHHLYEPQHLWSTIKQYASADTAIYICDLFRPNSVQQAQQIVDQYANKEPEILRTDFFNSLLAAFTPNEVRNQLSIAEIKGLNIDIVSDRHMLIYGFIE